MVRKELLNMQRLNATSKMIRVAQKDVPKKIITYFYGHPYCETRRQYQLYLRCRVENGILAVALYYPDNLRAEGRMPSYTVFIDRTVRRFITYDYINKKWLNAKMDRLDWPASVPMYPDTWMSGADAKTAADYLGSEKLGYEAILGYQLKLREEALLRRHKKETDPWDADLALTPALPKDWDRWVDKVGIPQNFMFYAYQKRGARTGYCSYCGKDVPLREKPYNNKTGQCPCCRHEVTYKAVGRLGRYLSTEEACVYLIQARPDGFVVREFWAKRRYSRENYKKPEVSCMEHWRVIYGGNEAYRSYYWGSYKNLCIRWIAGIPSYNLMGQNSIYCYHGNQDGRVYGKTLPHLAKGALKHNGLADWIYAHEFVANPDKYMSVREKIPQFEQIWKANLPQLMKECWHRPSCMDELIKEPQSPSLTKALGIDRQGLGRLRRFNGGCSVLEWLQAEKQSGKAIPNETIQWFLDHKIHVADLDFIWGKMNAIQIRNYLLRQTSATQESVRQTLTTWQDYLSMAERLGIDTNDEIVYRARLLRQRHNELVLRCKQCDRKEQALEVLKRFPKVDQICKSIKDKYEYANDEYAVITPSGVLDIIVEGDMLNHCLSGSDKYWDRIETHESYILFLRRASTPEIPHYTLEVEPDGTIRQKRSDFDRQEDDIEDAKKFLVEWQGVLAKRLTKSDRKKAATSRILREKEFEQLRRDNVMIRTGDLRGRRLVDILTADLMEAAA